MATYEDEQSCQLPLTEVNTSEGFQPRKEQEKSKVVAKIEEMWEDVKQWGKDFSKLSAREQRRFILAASAIVLGVMIITGCAPDGTQPGQVNPGDLPKDQTHEVTITAVSGTDATPVWTPTVGAGGSGEGGGDEPKIEPTPTVQKFETPTPERPEFIPNSGGPYSEAQWQLVESGAFVEQENQLKAWTEYWGKARNRPFLPGSHDLDYKYLFDLRDPTKAIVLLEATGPDYQGQIFGLPIKDGQFMTTPPSAPEGEFDIPEGFGPLPLSGGNEGLALANSDGLARVDSNGTVIQIIDMEKAQWINKQIEMTLSMNYAEPMRITWDQLFGQDKAKILPGDSFEFQGVGTWDQISAGPAKGGENFGPSILPPWIDEESGFLSVNAVPPQIVAENLHIDGWMLVTKPDGQEVLVMQESVRQMDGSTGKWLFGFDPKIASSKDYVDGWFSGKDSIYFFPMTYEEGHNFISPDWTNDVICAGRVQGDANYLAEFIRTGNIPIGMSEGLVIANPVRGK